VLEEYIRPARMMENGKIVTKPALSEPEYVDLEPVGTLEACNTDGLRTLLRTMKTPNMREKTLRYPGHIEYVRVLLDSGFFSKTPVEVGDVSVPPIDLTAKLLFRKWRLGRDEPDITLMRIRVVGEEDGAPKEYTYNLFDQYDEETGTLSMARTTGYTCSSVARLLLRADFGRKGICPPEYVGAAGECFEKVMSDLRDRGVIYRVDEGPPAG
jgi:lysine 6-dehydrogenase